MQSAAADGPDEPGADTARRRHVMAVLAAADREELAEALEGLGPTPAWRCLRGPETGLVMARGRAGGGGGVFNLGEVTVTRTTIELETGETGFSYGLGRDRRKSELAAVLDALWQRPRTRAAVESGVVAPLEQRRTAEDGATRRRTAATRVDFFTMVRGED